MVVPAGGAGPVLAIDRRLGDQLSASTLILSARQLTAPLIGEAHRKR
jgi:hypothetical protein